MRHDAEQIIREILGNVVPTQDLLLGALLEIQRRVGYVPQAGLPLIAQHFNLSRADVYGVKSFYRDLRDEPSPSHCVQICLAEACQAVGCRALASHAEKRLGTTMGTTAEAANIKLEAAYCFGNCACGPSVRIGDDIYGRVTPERFDELLAPLTGGPT